MIKMIQLLTNVLTFQVVRAQFPFNFEFDKKVSWIAPHPTTLDIYFQNNPDKAKPPNKTEFVIENDTCEKYHLPDGQQYPLIYDQKFLPTFGTNSKNVTGGTWQILETIKLPVMCLICKNEDENTNFLFYEAGSNDLLNRSSLCVSKGTTGYNFHPLYEKIITVENLQKLKLKLNTMMESPDRNRFISRRYQSFQKNILYNSSQKALSSVNAYQMALDQQISLEWQLSVDDSQKWNTSIPNLINQTISLACLSVNTNDTLNMMDNGTIQTWDKKLDRVAFESIRTKGLGCQSCISKNPDNLMSNPSNNNPYSFILSDFDNGIPLNAYSSLKDIPLRFGCSNTPEIIQMSTNKVMGIQSFHTYIQMEIGSNFGEKYIEKPCYGIIANCAICGGWNPYICKMCFDGYSMVNVTNREELQTGSVRKMEITQKCMKDFCPQGFMQIHNQNGISYCEPCSIKFCKFCAMVENEGIQKEVCLDCQGGFFMSDQNNFCIKINVMFIKKEDQQSKSLNYVEKQEQNKQELNVYFILEEHQKDIYSNPQNMTQKDIEQIKENEKNYEFVYLQQVIHHLNTFKASYDVINANIYLTRGDHFFFYCDKLLTSNEITDQFQNLCQLPSMQNGYPENDNLRITVKALGCIDEDSVRLEKSATQRDWFLRNCMLNNKERPVIHVNSADFYFNITNSATFQNVVFDGINSFAVINNKD